MARHNAAAMDRAKNKTRLWSRDFVIVMIASSGIAFCNHFFTSTLPIYALNLTGSDVYSGFLMAAFTVAALVTRPFSGALSDRFGRVRLLIAGAALCAAACFLYNFSATIVLLILIRSLHGIGFGIHSTSGGAVAGDIIPKARMSEGLGFYGLYATVASAIGPGIALSIIGDGQLGNFRPLFILAACIAAACIVLDSLIRYERRKTAEAEAAPPEPAAGEEQLPKTFLGFEYGVFLPAAVIILVFIASASVMSFLAVFARDREMGNIGLYFTLSAAGMFLSRAFLGKVADRRGADILIIPALCLMVLCFGAIPFAQTALQLYFIALPMGIAQGAVAPTINSMIYARCSARRRGSASAAYFAAIDIGIAVGSIIFGFIADRFGYGIIFWCAMVFAAAAAAVYILFLRKKKTAGDKTA